jgi:hypothetical protein
MNITQNLHAMMVAMATDVTHSLIHSHQGYKKDIIELVCLFNCKVSCLNVKEGK